MAPTRPAAPAAAAESGGVSGGGTAATAVLRLISATYGPSDGRRLLGGEMSCTEAARVPYTRDVLPFLRALLAASGCGGDDADGGGGEVDYGGGGRIDDVPVDCGPGSGGGACSNSVAVRADLSPRRGACTTSSGRGRETPGTSGDESDPSACNRHHQEHQKQQQQDMQQRYQNMHRRYNHRGPGRRRRKVAVPVMDGKSMNAVFGDPCPGTTKCLRVKFVFCDDEMDDDDAYCDGVGDVSVSGGINIEAKVEGEDARSSQQVVHKRRAAAAAAATLSKEEAKERICRASFQEHERVILRRARTFYQDEGQVKRVARAASLKQRQHQSRQRCGNCGADPVDDGRGSTCSSGVEEKKGTESKDVTDSALPSATADQPSKVDVDASDGDVDEDEVEAELRALRSMGRSQSIAEMAQIGSSPRMSPTPMLSPVAKSPTPLAGVMPLITEDPSGLGSSSAAAASDCSMPRPQQSLPPITPRKWRLRSATSEIVLPLALPYLEVRQRALCQLVCKTWRFVVQDWGVAQTVDVNDPSFPNFTRSLLRGIMAQSHSSLQSLILNDFADLTRDDLHPAIPHLRKLRTLDISRCIQLDDSTLRSVSEHLGDTLEVFYMKGLVRATDAGLTAVCESCRKVRVLEVSNVPITDRTGLAIGENLNKLEALYMRDNFRLTNDSIDVITEKCTKLTQLTLWGCTRLRRLSLGGGNSGGSLSPSASPVPGSGCSEIVLLNLWGCHSLADEVAASMGLMPNLKSLIVSECHKLTDEFVVNLSQAAPHIHHLHLRYVRRISDVGVNAIANGIHNLYSLDLSFCTRITPSSLVYLLENSRRTLSELRLYSCYQLDMTVPQQHDNTRPVTNAGVGRLLLDGIRSTRSGEGSCLSILDVRECRGRHHANEESRRDDAIFIGGMQELRFEQKIPGFFSRPARWNYDVERRLVEQFVREDSGSFYD